MVHDMGSDRLEKYLALKRDIARLTQWAAANPDRSAGVWFVRGAEGEGPRGLGVGIVGDLAQAEAELRALIDDPAVLTVVPKRFTEAELRSLQERISVQSMNPRQQPAAYRVTLIGVDVIANKTEVGIDPYTETFAAELCEEYGEDRIVVTHHSFNSDSAVGSPLQPQQPEQ